MLCIQTFCLTKRVRINHIISIYFDSYFNITVTFIMFIKAHLIKLII